MATLSQIGNKVSLTQRAYEEIKNAIIMNEFKPGQILIEEALAKELNISRTPVRSALKMLEYEHLIIINPSKNVVVSDFNNKDLVDATVVRCNIEPLAASLLAEIITASQLENLEETEKKQVKAYSEKDYNKFIKYEYEFHTLIAKYTDNIWLFRTVESINTMLQRVLVLSGSLGKYCSIALDEHKEILDAFREHNAKKAEDAMRIHVKNVCERVVEKF